MSAMSDPTLLDVINNALAGISDAMANTVVRTSRSSVVRLGYDFSTALLSPEGELVGQGLCQPIHMGGMPPALRACLDTFEGRIAPGDVLINNDPYEGGSHLPDIFLFKPIYAGDRLVAHGCAMSHHVDIGGRVAGGNASDSTEIQQEGLRIPPLKLYEAGRPNETLFRVLEKAVRVPEKVLGDLAGQMAALRLAERETLRLVDRYGAEGLIQLQHDLLNYTESVARKGLAALPDGTWCFTDYIDDDGFQSEAIAITVRLAKQGDEIEADFEGTSSQVAGAINTPLDSTKSMVYAVVRSVLGGDIPNTGGYFRPVSVKAPEGSFVNPLPPAAVAARFLGCLRVSQAVFGAFAQMLPERVPACSGGSDANVTMAGYHRAGDGGRRAWIQVEGVNEVAAGGSALRDGLDAQSSAVSNITNIPAELIEADHPIRIDEYALLPDTEGAGAHRGGLGMVRQYRFLADDTMVQFRADRMRHPPYGLAGGGAARGTRIRYRDGLTGEERDMPSKFITRAGAEDSVRLEMPGGGGWGDPLARAPSAVLADVVAEKVTPARARAVYGVVLDAGRRVVDEAATAAERAARATRSAAE